MYMKQPKSGESLREPMAKKSGKTWLIPSNVNLPADGRTKEAGEEKKANVNSNQTTVGFTSEGAESRVCDEFKKTYMRNPENVLFTPYRICPIGAHSDQPPLRPRHPAHPG